MPKAEGGGLMTCPYIVQMQRIVQYSTNAAHSARNI